MPVTVPTPAEYARLPYEQRRHVVDALRDLLARWAETEKRSTTGGA